MRTTNYYETQKLRGELQSKSTDELRMIYAEEYHKKQRTKAFLISAEILRERGVSESPPKLESEKQTIQVSPQRVLVTDIKMPFGSMVGFMVKWTLASIPAMLILLVFGFVAFVVLSMLGGIFSGFFGK